MSFTLLLVILGIFVNNQPTRGEKCPRMAIPRLRFFTVYGPGQRVGNFLSRRRGKCTQPCIRKSSSAFHSRETRCHGMELVLAESTALHTTCTLS